MDHVLSWSPIWISWVFAPKLCQFHLSCTTKQELLPSWKITSCLESLAESFLKASKKVCKICLIWKSAKSYTERKRENHKWYKSHDTTSETPSITSIMICYISVLIHACQGNYSTEHLENIAACLHSLCTLPAWYLIHRIVIPTWPTVCAIHGISEGYEVSLRWFTTS